MPFYPLLGKGSPTKIDYRKKGTLILSSLLEDLVSLAFVKQEPLASCGIFEPMTYANREHSRRELG